MKYHYEEILIYSFKRWLSRPNYAYLDKIMATQ